MDEKKYKTDNAILALLLEQQELEEVKQEVGLVSNGDEYETHAGKFFTTDDIITLRDKATVGLGSTNFAGIKAKKYDGLNDGQLVFDADGYARVGDEDSLQMIATRENTPTNKGIAYYDETTRSFKTKAESSLSVAQAVNANKLGGVAAANYYHSGNSNNSLIDWHSKLMYVGDSANAKGIIGRTNGVNKWLLGSGAIIDGGSDNDLGLYSYDGQVSLWQSGNKRFETTSSGTKTTGNHFTTGLVQVKSTNTHFDSDNTSLYLKSVGGSIYFYANNTQCFRVNANGTVTTGTGTLNGSSSYNNLQLTSDSVSHSIQRVGLTGRAYATTTTDIGIVSLYADATTNQVMIGGGGSALKAATQIDMFIGDTLNTIGGTKRFSVDMKGTKTIGNHTVSSTTISPIYHVVNHNTKLTQGNGNALRIATNNGYADLGAMNTSYFHLQTDRPKFYFNKPLDTEIGYIVYGTSTALYNNKLQFSGGNYISNTGSYLGLASGGNEIQITGQNANLHVNYRLQDGLTAPTDWYWKAGSSGSNTSDYASHHLRDIYSHGTIGSHVFTSGFTGSGWRVDHDGTANFDNAYIRKTLNVYELLIQKIRSVNGSIVVSSANGKVVSTSLQHSGSTMEVILEEAGGFVVGDRYRCQTFRASKGVKYYVSGNIGWIDPTGKKLHVYNYVSSWDGTDFPEVGDEIVQWGSTVTDRQGMLYMTASDSGAPYFDVLDGVNGANMANKTKVRLGKLDGITSSTFGVLSGYGLWTQNGYLEGGINATFGKIARWNIAGDRIWGGTGIFNGSSSRGLDLYTDGNYSRVLAYSDKGYVNHYYYSPTDWGLLGQDSTGAQVFKLGSQNNIAGWNFTENALYTTKGSYGDGVNIGLYKESQGTDSALHAYEGLQGLKITYYNDFTGGEDRAGVRAVVGALSDSYFYKNEENGKYGFELVGGRKVANWADVIFRASVIKSTGELDCRIAGWNFKKDSLYTTNGSTYLSLGSPVQWASSWYGLQAGKDGSNRVWIGSNATDTEITAYINSKYYFQAGTRGCSIAGWTFTDTKLYKGNLNLSASGGIYAYKSGVNYWHLKNDGSGQLAQDAIKWDTSGNVTFSSGVKLGWSNADSTLTSRITQGAVPITWVKSSGITVDSDGGVRKSGGSTGWNAQAYSNEGVTGACSLSWTVENYPNNHIMFGLNESPSSSASYSDIDYEFYCDRSYYEVRVNGSTISGTRTAHNNDNAIFGITYDESFARFYVNSKLVHSVAASAGKTLHVDSSFYIAGANTRITNVDFRKGTAYNSCITTNITNNTISTTNVVANNLKVKSANVSGKLTAATIDAAKIDTGYLNAARIATGSLHGNKITAGTITADHISGKVLTGVRVEGTTLTTNVGGDSAGEGTTSAINIETNRIKATRNDGAIYINYKYAGSGTNDTIFANAANRQGLFIYGGNSRFEILQAHYGTEGSKRVPYVNLGSHDLTNVRIRGKHVRLQNVNIDGRMTKGVELVSGGTGDSSYGSYIGGGAGDEAEVYIIHPTSGKCYIRFGSGDLGKIIYVINSNDSKSLYIKNCLLGHTSFTLAGGESAAFMYIGYSGRTDSFGGKLKFGGGNQGSRYWKALFVERDANW